MRGPVDVSVVTSGHDVADARLHREVAALIARGIRVEVLGLGCPDDGPPGADVRTWPRTGSIRRASLAAQMAARSHGRVLLALDPDSALAANAAVLSSGRVLVVDVHEDYARLLADRTWATAGLGLVGLGARGMVQAFMSVAKRAALTVVADDHVPPLTARKRLVLPNMPVRSMLPDPCDPGPEPRALYVGDVRQSRGVFAMLEALRLAPDWRLDIVGPVAPADQGRLDEELASPELAGRVTLHGRRPPTQSWAYARGAWCGLMLLSDTPAFIAAIPSKLDEYLACGLPVVSTDLPRQAAIIRDSVAGAVVPCGTDARVGGAVAEILRSWSAAPESLVCLRQGALESSQTRLRTAGSPYDDFAVSVAALL